MNRTSDDRDVAPLERVRAWAVGLDTGQRLYYAALLAIVLLGGYLRLRRLGVAPLWIDEAYSSWAARNFLAGNGFSDPIGPSSPYRRAWLTTSLPIAASFSLFGLSEFAARLPMTIYGMGSILVAWRLGNRYDRLLGLLLAAFVAFDPFMLVWAREARMYAPLQFLYLLSIYVIVGWYDNGLRLRSVSPFVLAVLVLLGRNTNQAYLALGASTVVFLLFEAGRTLWRERPGSVDAVSPFTKRALLFGGGGLAVGVALIIVAGTPGVLTATASSTWPNRDPTYYWSLFKRAYPLLLYTAVPGAVALWYRHRTGGLLVLAFVLPFLVASITPRKAPRYVYHLAPLLACFGLYPIAASLRLLWEKVTEDADDGEISIGTRAIAYAVPLLVVLAVASPLAGYAVTESVYDPPFHPGSSDWEKASDYVEQRAEDDAVIVSTRPELSMWYHGKTDYFFRQNGIARTEVQDGRLVHTRTGAVFLNDTASIRQLLEQDRAIWFFAGKKFQGSFTAPEARQLVREEFTRVAGDGWVTMEVYHYEPSENGTDATNRIRGPASVGLSVGRPVQ